MGLIIAAMYYQQGIGSGLNLYGLFLNTVMFLSFANSKSARRQNAVVYHVNAMLTAVSEMSATMSLKIIAYRQVLNDQGLSVPDMSNPLAYLLTSLHRQATGATHHGLFRLRYSSRR